MTSSHIGAWLGFDQNLYRFLDGQIDEMAVYGTALSPARIAAHYHAAASIEITQQPVDTSAIPSGNATFTVVAQPMGAQLPLQYQWKRNGSPIPNATNATYMTGPLGSTDNGTQYQCALTAGGAMTESAQAFLTIIDTATAYPQAVLADQPVLYYRLEEQAGSKAFDSSGNGFHGVYANVVPEPGPLSVLGSSARFHVWTTKGNIAVPALINPASGNSSFTELTVEAWVKVNGWNDSAEPNDFGLSGIFCGDMWPSGSFQLVARNPSSFAFGVRDSSSVGSSDDYRVSDYSVFITNMWLHIATVYDAGAKTFGFYTNGVRAAVVNLNDAPPAFVTTSHIGAWMGFDGNLYRFLDGQIDEVAIYATALAPARIAAHYQAVFPQVTSPVITYTIQAGALRLEWAGTGFVLQQNTDLVDPSGWMDVPAGNASPVMINPGQGQEFFRLKKP